LSRFATLVGEGLVAAGFASPLPALRQTVI
jgi:hypothetical protein